MSEQPTGSELDPSLTADVTILPPMERLRAAMDKVIPLLESGYSETEMTHTANAYVMRRAKELSATDPGRLVGKNAGGTSTFVGPDTPLAMAGMGNSYRLDDPTAYEAAFPSIRATYAQLRQTMPPDQAYLNAVLAGVNYGQAYYFQSYFGDGEARFAASLDIIDGDEVEQGSTSIADYKGSALCLERAAVAHNTALIYGIHSRLHVGYLSKVTKDGAVTGEEHAFLTFLNKVGHEYILDPTNPVVFWDEDGTVATIKPAIYRRTPGVEEQEVELKEYTIVNGQTVVKDTHKLTYAFDTALT